MATPADDPAPPLCMRAPTCPGRSAIPALSAAEQEQLLAVLNAERFADKSPAQAWAVLLDEGIYLASISTMYRVLRAADQVRGAPRPPTPPGPAPS